MLKKGRKHARYQKLKERIGWFYKINFSVLLIVSLVLAYFLVLVSIGPKSIPYITNKIESNLKEKFGEDVSLEKSYISFTRYGTLKVAIDNLKVFYTVSNSEDRKGFLIPKLESEFSLFKILTLRFQPSKVKIINPEIVIDNFDNPQVLEKNKDDTNHSAMIIAALSSIRDGDFAIKNFEIENATLIVRNQTTSTKFIIKRSQIITSKKDDSLFVSSENILSFDDKKSDVNLVLSCQLRKNNDTKCDLLLENFVANSIANLHPMLLELNKIDAMVNLNTSFSVVGGEMNNVVFKAEAKNGSFSFLEFFSQKIDFNNFILKGEYDNKIGILNLSEIKADFLSDPQLPQPPVGKVQNHNLEMSLLISNLKNQQNKKFDFYIKLKDIKNNELEKFWPSALHQEGVRDWVISHISEGLIKDAYARFSLLTDNAAGMYLDKIDSEVVFSGFKLQYGESFPVISNVSGVANFTKDSMRINISEADALNSKIYNGVVAIDSFNRPDIMLNITGSSKGKAFDGLKHAAYKSSFATEVEKYLNGNSQSSFAISLPLSKEITLKNSYIEVNSAISDLVDNGYVKGNLIINSKKNFNSNDFVTNANLSAAELTAKAFDVEKKPNVESGLSLVVSVENSKKITLKNILLWKSELSQDNKITNSKIFGNIEIDTDSAEVIGVNIKNDNFGKNNYLISYKIDKQTLNQKLSIVGEQLNLASFVEGKFSIPSSSKPSPYKLRAQINIDNTILVNKKSLKKLSLSLNCNNGFCFNASIKGKYGKGQFISLDTDKKSTGDIVLMSGRITDVGYLAEGLGISSVISSGDAKIKMQNKIIDKKPVLNGQIEIDNKITIFDNPAVKKLSKNTLFSEVRDTIFSNDKTIFDSLKMEFYLENNIINIVTLIANNYKIGITAKGSIDLKNDIYNISGMIVPGFIINNLFGIGKIPIIGGVISGLLTGGEGGGVFGIHYDYTKKIGDKEAKFETNKVSAFVPTTIRNLFDSF